MPQLPSPTALPRLDVPAKGGLWKLRQRFKSFEDRRKEMCRTLLLPNLSFNERLGRLRTLVDLGLWGDHATDAELAKSLEPAKGIKGVIREMLEAFEEPALQNLNASKGFSSQRQALGFSFFASYNNGLHSSRLMHLCLEGGMDPNWREGNNYDDTLLTMFARNFSTPHINLLLDAGANVHDQDTCYETAFHLLIKYAKHHETREEAHALMQRLLDKGYDINSPGKERREGHDQHQTPPLVLACSQPDATTVQWLLERGAKVDAANAQGTTPWHEAAMNQKNTAVFEVLRQYDQNFDVEMKDLTTPLHCAIKWCNGVAAQWLVDHGARMDTHLDHPSGKIASALQLLMELHACKGWAQSIAQQIVDRHPDCLHWKTPKGETLSQWCEQNSSEWSSVLQHAHLQEHTQTVSGSAARPRL